jgi:hypothetical protein
MPTSRPKHSFATAHREPTPLSPVNNSRTPHMTSALPMTQHVLSAFPAHAAALSHLGGERLSILGRSDSFSPEHPILPIPMHSKQPSGGPPPLLVQGFLYLERTFECFASGGSLRRSSITHLLTPGPGQRAAPASHTYRSSATRLQPTVFPSLHSLHLRVVAVASYLPLLDALTLHLTRSLLVITCSRREARRGRAAHRSEGASSS